MEKEASLYRKKLEHYYSEDGKLTRYPSKRPMRIIALIKIAEQFEAGKQYREKEVNGIIQSAIAFQDIELIRRELYEYKFLGRQRDGSSYWLEENWREIYSGYMEVE